MRMVAEWNPGKILSFFRTGGVINASQYEAMDEDTRAAFKVLFSKAEEDRVSLIIERLTGGLREAMSKAAAASHEDVPPKVDAFPGVTSRGGD